MNNNLERHLPPQFGWRLKLNHEFPEKPRVFVFPRLSQVTKLAGMAYRYIRFTQRQRRSGKTPFIDPYAVSSCKQIYGVPIGGIGAGTIGRGWKGDFNRWQLIPGMYSYDIVEVNQFTVCIRKGCKTVYQQVLSPTAPNGKLNCEKNLQGWTWSFDGGRAFYHALYPRAWTVYEIPAHSLRLTCRQVSPIFPDDYKDTSLPVGVFVWTVENLGCEEMEVSIMFTFQNGDGGAEDSAGGHRNEEFCCKGIYSEIKLENVDGKREKCCEDSDGSSMENSVVDSSTSPENTFEKSQSTIVAKTAESSEVNNNLIHSSSQENRTVHDVHGVLMHHNGLKKSFTLAIAALQVQKDSTDIVHVSTKAAFDPKSPCRKVWEDLMDDGMLTNKIGDPVNKNTFPGQTLAAAVVAKTSVKAESKVDLHFVLAWDQPVVKFGAHSEVAYCRRYTRFFGTNGNACPSLCCYAIQNVASWESKIEAWQNPILSDNTLPDWFKSALFNELYFISDGGTIWLDIKRKKDVHHRIIPDTVKTYGRFAYLEGHEYRMYNTYDVHFYASWALAMLWPKLQLSVQYDIATSCLNEDNEIRLMMMAGQKAFRKVSGCVPHDLGDPDDEPFVRVNAYCIHDTSCWKDLNLHFVLQVYRDYYITKDTQYLMDMWPAMKAVMSHSMSQDTDGDGIIDNSGFADNTFDCWVVTGPSAYTGGLWLSALKCMIEIAHVLELSDKMSKFKSVLERGKRSFERKLWNGMYFNYDGSENEHHNSIMAGQCAGQWYLHACDLAQNDEDAVFRKEQIRSTLKVIFQNNVMRFEGGFMGAVNGMRADGTVDKDSLQAEEVWTGVTYALAATMIQQGMVKEGFRTAEGIYRTVYEKWGLAFQTPEAITCKRTFRSRGYMRPLSIWSIYHAFVKRKNDFSNDDYTPLKENVC